MNCDPRIQGDFNPRHYIKSRYRTRHGPHCVAYHDSVIAGICKPNRANSKVGVGPAGDWRCVLIPLKLKRRCASCGNTEGIFVTHRAVSGLNDTVVAALRKAGVPALGVHPLHTGIADNGRLVGFECRHLEKMLALGMVPVIHGDVVMDLSKGACIVSGDQLVRYLAVALRISRVGLATDVPGVLDGGVVVPEITRKTVPDLQIGNSNHTDVTGGMRGKIDELLILADAGIRSDIFHVSRIPDFLADEA